MLLVCIILTKCRKREELYSLSFYPRNKLTQRLTQNYNFRTDKINDVHLFQSEKIKIMHVYAVVSRIIYASSLRIKKVFECNSAGFCFKEKSS